MNIVDLSATELRRRFRDGQLSAVEITQAYLQRIERLDGRVGAFLAIEAEQALAQARDIDSRRAAGTSLGALAGVPVAVKDLLCCRGQRTTCGSRMLAEFRPPYDATVVARLRQADAILIGKTNLDEFAMGSSTENSALQITRNPWNLQHVPGGSSGGAAACIAASMAPLSIGTDTGGSIRQPAAYCGVLGLKPTYGRVSRYGLIAFASSLDQIGPLAWTAEDAAMLLEVIAGQDPRDSTCAPMPAAAYSQSVTQPLQGLRLGVPREHLEAEMADDVAEAVQQAIDVYRSLGAEVQSISLPHNKYAIAAYYLIAPSEASSNLARFDGAHYGYRTDEGAMIKELADERQQFEAAGDVAAVEQLDSPLVRMYRRTRAEGFGPEVKRRIMLGTYALSAGYYDAYYLKAQKVRRLIRQDYDQVFGQIDLIVGPATPTAAFRLGQMADDPLAMYLQDLFTVSANLAGIASLSLPCGFTSDGLPIGLQLQAPPFQEDRLLRAAHMFQQATDWHQRRPSCDE